METLFQKIEQFVAKYPNSQLLPFYLKDPLCRAFQWETGVATLYGYDFALRTWTEPAIEPSAQAAYMAMFQARDLATPAQTLLLLRNLKAALQATNQPND